ncbi:transcriptional regulator [Methylobacterium gossipiicola]|uniref:transcriptional regulator n=1 Tax=Methylobacterium gossipiicola TaxID=582675 RepID=UPI000B837F3A|nr:YdaS family helix-turn-helix protein [Methylobacterium gossipiicola]
MSPNHQALARAIEVAGGQAGLAKAIGTSQSNVWTWLNKSKRGAPAEWALRIEAVTQVSRHDLRSDVFPAPAEVAA